MLPKELHVVHEPRRHDRREVARLSAMLRAIAIVRRDRHAGSSPLLRGHCVQLARLLDVHRVIEALAGGVV